MVELSVSEVASKTGVYHSTINQMERGTKDFDILNLKRLADVYGVELKDIFQ